VTVHVQVDDVITLTTTTGQTKGNYTGVPDDARFPTTYVDNFDSYPADAAAAYFTEMSGAFDVHVGPDSTSLHNSTLRQNAVGFPVKWLRGDIIPFAVMGDSEWVECAVHVRPPTPCPHSTLVNPRRDSPGLGRIRVSARTMQSVLYNVHN
jgi:galactosylceramidase